MLINFEDGKQYILSFDWKVEEIVSGEKISTGLTFWYTDNTNDRLISLFSGKVSDYGHKVVSSDLSKHLLYVSSAGWQYSGLARLSNIQLEENNIETVYEPYYITKDTIVTQSKNHTLTAIWE